MAVIECFQHLPHVYLNFAGKDSRIMGDYLAPNFEKLTGEISTPALAHIGDAVFELMVRTYLCTSGTHTAKKLHSGTVAMVSAKAQAEAAEHILPLLTEDEFAVYKRGRNHHINQVPKGCTLQQYLCATGLESLFGYLYISGDTKRLNSLFESIISKMEC